MIRTLERRAYTGNLLFCKFTGNSGDSKPTTGIVTGSSFLEVDTGLNTCLTRFPAVGLRRTQATAKRPLRAQP